MKINDLSPVSERNKFLVKVGRASANSEGDATHAEER